MKPESDKPIRPELKILLDKLDKVLKDYKDLNDAEKVLQTNKPEFLKIMKNYKADLAILHEFYQGDVIEKLVDFSQEEFYKQVEKYVTTKTFKKSLEIRSKLMTAIEKEYSGQMKNVIQGIVSNQIAKKYALDVSARAVSLPKRTYEGQLNRTVSLKATKDSPIIMQQNLNNIWDDLSKNFGTNETIQYRNGVNYPLNTYIQGKNVTISQEVSTMTTVIESARHKIYTGKLSNHNAKDSCRLHESEIVFMSEQAKKEYKKEFPKDKNANWKTLQEIKNDKTHFFKFQCRHTVTAYPLQYMSDKKREQTPKANVIKEKEIKEIDKAS